MDDSFTSTPFESYKRTLPFRSLATTVNFSSNKPSKANEPNQKQFPPFAIFFKGIWNTLLLSSLNLSPTISQSVCTKLHCRKLGAH